MNFIVVGTKSGTNYLAQKYNREIMKISNTVAVHHRISTFLNVLIFSFPFPMVVRDSKVGLH